ncbi:MAG: asparagine synthase-related protein [Campylobacterota bacterium]|nr:asparagine synthase-related protein [Campylobacterota bacterium]
MGGLFGNILYEYTDNISCNQNDNNNHYCDYLHIKNTCNISLKLQENNKKAKIYRHKQYAVAFYGEIYNLNELADTLHISPHSTTIESIIVKLFKQKGTDCFTLLNGSFSFALYDQYENKIYLVRDKVGTKPFYFYTDNNIFLFGTSLKDFNKTSYFKKHLNTDALALYFQFSYIPQPYSIYENTHKVHPGGFACYDLANKSCKQHQYWRIESTFTQKNHNLTEQDAVNRTHEYLKKAVQARSHKQSKYGSFLSGGYDSSLIAAILQKNSSHKLDTFTIGFDDSKINEAIDAKKIASFLETRHTEYYFTQQDALNIVQKLPHIYDEPLADSAPTPSVMIGQLAKEAGVSLLFGGDGGDEVFGTELYLDPYNNTLSIPKSLRQVLYQLLRLLPMDSLPLLKNMNNLPTKQYKLLSLLKANNIQKIIKTLNLKYTPLEVTKLLQRDFTSLNTPFDTVHFDNTYSPINIWQGTDILGFLLNCELVKSNTALNSMNIDFSTPFLDEDLIKFMGTVPTSISMRNSIGKYIAKQIAYQYLPKSLLDRKKSGFSIPLEHWFNGSLKPLLLDTLHEDRLKADGILNPYEVEKIKNNFFAGHTIYKHKLWALLTFQLWHNENMH